MTTVKNIAAAIFGILFIAAIIGYSGGEEIPDVPKPDAGLCGVTKEAYDTVPGSGAVLDIEVDITWDDSTVWIGIITVEDYESLEKLGGNSDGEIFHIMIGSLEEADDEEDDDDGDPWPFDEVTKSHSFVDEFNVDVEFDVSGGWGTLLILILVEFSLAYLILASRINLDNPN